MSFLCFSFSFPHLSLISLVWRIDQHLLYAGWSVLFCTVPARNYAIPHFLSRKPGPSKASLVIYIRSYGRVCAGGWWSFKERVNVEL